MVWDTGKAVEEVTFTMVFGDWQAGKLEVGRKCHSFCNKEGNVHPEATIVAESDARLGLRTSH